MRYLIEVQPDAFADVWYPARMTRSAAIAVYDQFADADRVFKDARITPPSRSASELFIVSAPSRRSLVYRPIP